LHPWRDDRRGDGPVRTVEMTSMAIEAFPLTWPTGWKRPDEVNDAYRRLAREHHPDKGGERLRQHGRGKQKWRRATGLGR
jgi:hypothetical protein